MDGEGGRRRGAATGEGGGEGRRFRDLGSATGAEAGTGAVAGGTGRRGAWRPRLSQRIGRFGDRKTREVS